MQIQSLSALASKKANQLAQRVVQEDGSAVRSAAFNLRQSTTTAATNKATRAEAPAPAVSPLQARSASLSQASGATAAGEGVNPPRSWASAWREGWANLTEASKQIRELAAQAQQEGTSEEQLASIRSQINDIASQAVAQGRKLLAEVRPQLGGGQIAFWQHAFSMKNLGLPQGGLGTGKDALNAGQLDANATRIQNYNNWMVGYHQANGWA
jgi:hypothetical protein